LRDNFSCGSNSNFAILKYGEREAQLGGNGDDGGVCPMELDHLQKILISIGLCQGKFSTVDCRLTSEESAHQVRGDNAAR
jgi:hypothetical protein